MAASDGAEIGFCEVPNLLRKPGFLTAILNPKVDYENSSEHIP